MLPQLSDLALQLTGLLQFTQNNNTTCQSRPPFDLSKSLKGASNIMLLSHSYLIFRVLLVVCIWPSFSACFGICHIQITSRPWYSAPAFNQPPGENGRPLTANAEEKGKLSASGWRQMVFVPRKSLDIWHAENAVFLKREPPCGRKQSGVCNMICQGCMYTAFLVNGMVMPPFRSTHD